MLKVEGLDTAQLLHRIQNALGYESTVGYNIEIFERDDGETVNEVMFDTTLTESDIDKLKEKLISTETNVELRKE